MPDLVAMLRDLHGNGGLTLPTPGSGATPQRHSALFELGRRDLSLARLAEAHADAISICMEADHLPRNRSLYGVWASDGPKSLLQVAHAATGQLQLDGTKRYCSGAPLLDAALVTAHAPEGLLLLEVPLDAAGLIADTTEWGAPAFSATQTATVTFSGVVLDRSAVLGSPGWYLTRPGFWHGALGPAACWAGGAAGLIDAVRATRKADPHFLAQLGALEAAGWALQAMLDQAGVQIDSDPLDHANESQRRTLMCRHLIERTCTEVLDRFGRATGPQLLAFDSRIAQHYAELTLYIRQSHAERDLAAIPHCVAATQQAYDPSRAG